MRVRLAIAAALSSVLFLVQPVPVSATGGGQVLVLENGMPVVLLRDPGAEMVASVVVVHSGLRDEPDELNGVSHLLEHLLFNGTERRTQKRLYDEVDAIGGYNNAHTAEDHTTFMMLVPSGWLRRGLDIQADMLFHSILPREKLEKERGIVLREIDKDRDAVTNEIDRDFRALLLRGTPYARPILGPRSVVESIRREDIYRFYKSHYVPNNMTLLLIGGFDPDSAIVYLRETFGLEVPGSLPERSPSRLARLSRDGLVRSARTVPEPILRIGAVGPVPRLDDVVAMEVGIRLLNSESGPWSLTNAIRQRFGAGVRSASAAYEFHPDLSVLTVEVKADTDVDEEELFSITCDLLRRYPGMELGASDLESAKLALQTEDAVNRERPHFWGMLKAPYVACFGPEAIGRYREALNDLNVSSLRRSWEAWLRDVHFSGLFVGPAKKGKGDRVRATTQLSVFRLSNGLTVIARQDAGSELFAASLICRDRKAMEPEGKDGIADLLHRIMVRSSKTRPDGGLERELEAIGASVQATDMPWVPYDDYYTEPDFSFVRLECLADKADLAIALLAEAAQSPALTAAELDRSRREAIRELRFRNASASYRSARLFWGTLLEGHPMGRPIFGTVETLSSVTANDLAEFAEAYLSPENLVLGLVSPHDSAQVQAWLEDAFQARSSGSTVSISATPPNAVRGIHREKDLRGSGRAYLRMGNVVSVLDENDVPALMAAAQVLSSRLAFDLRETRGWAYSIGFGAQMFGSWGVYQAWMNLASRNLEEAEAAIREHTARLRNSPPTPDELERAVNQVRSRYAMRFLRRVNRAFYAAVDYHRTGKPDWTPNWLARMDDVTPEDVRRAAEKYLSEEDWLIVWAD